MNGLLSIVLSITILKYAFADINDTITISTSSGKVKGFIMETLKGREVAAFLGIPYGQPPVGNLRFKTNESFEELYPVLVYIFGGAFVKGQSMQSLLPHPLLDENLIMVSMNYRIGVFGYATTLDEVLPGNYGQLDQILALKWVQENIAYFGGDPKSVTLYGYSSGAMATMANVVSPLSNGLIHRAFIGSGCALCKQTLCHTSAKFTSQIAKRFNSSATSSQSIKDVLENIQGSEFAVWIGTAESSFMYNVDNTSGYMPLVPDEMAYQPNVAKIPLMIGVLPNDGAFLGRKSYSRSKNSSNFVTSLRWFLEELKSFSSANMEKNIKLILAEYNIQHPENMSGSEILKYLMDFATDLQFASCCDISIETLSRAGFPVYAYKFNYVSNLTKSDDGIILGHGSDIQFMGSVSEKEKYSPMTGSDLKTSRNMIEFWTNFAKYGNPNPVHSKPGEDDDGLPVWRQWTLDSPGHILLNESPSMEDGYFSNHTQFWKNNSMC